jgi:hypothetical protein
MTYNYQRKENIIEITIKNPFGAKMDFFRSNNPNNTKKVSRIIKDKYGIDLNPTIPKEKSINDLKEEETQNFLDKDISWD